MNPTWAAYRALCAVAGALAPAAAWAMPRDQRARWNERLGRASVPTPAHAWIHAASMGEAVAAGALVSELRRRSPGARFHFTATTLTGRERLARLGPVSLAPLDSPQATACFFASVRPRRLFVLETELWPHWLLRARRDDVPVAILSARLSARSLARLHWLGGELQSLVSGLEAVLCQSDDDRARWLALGARPDRTRVVGNLKLDALPVAASDRPRARRALGLDPDRPLLVLASLRPGEAKALAEAWRRLPEALRARWQVVAVPRHVRASAALREEARGAGVTWGNCAVPAREVWRWDDGAGVLAYYYPVCDAAFVGGSLEPYGGHNPLEPASCGVPILMGPHNDSQQQAVRALDASGGLRVTEPGEALASALATLLGDDADRARRGEAARGAIVAMQGVARRAADRLEEWKLWPVS